MNTETPKSTDNYFQLRNTIDKQIKKLEVKHKKHLSCKSGCDLCCMDYNIFPVEFYSILKELKNEKLNVQPGNKEKAENGGCIFLKNHTCSIYHSRPIICRTHGLPLLYTNNDDEWELSTCELNFTQYDFDLFTDRNTFSQDVYNSELFILNRKFIADFKDKKYGEKELIPIKKLNEFLEQ